MVGANLRRLRERKKLNLTELMNATHVHRITIAEIEDGVRNPRVETLQKLGRALGVEVAAFFREVAP